MSDNDTNKVFIHGQTEATFVCPKCGVHKTVDISKFKEIDKAVRLKIKCRPCGNVFSVLLERRQNFRVPTKLAGVYIIMRNKQREPIKIQNLSRTGMKFKLYFKKTPLKIDDRLLIEFTLDDPMHTLIKKEAIVRNIKELDIGVEFYNQTEFDSLFQYLFYSINREQ